MGSRRSRNSHTRGSRVMNTYHIYFDGQCLFKNLTESEFNIIYGKIYSSYFGERITYEVITEVPTDKQFEHSY